MLTHDRLVELHRKLADQPVLSIYIDGDQHDPAERNSWRTRLEQGIDQVRTRLNGAADGEREALERALARVRDRLAGFEAFLPDKAFVAFATPDGLQHEETVSVRMPDVARWGRGIVVAPYVRGLKQERPVVVALLDSQRSRVFRYQDGGVAEIGDRVADTFMGDLTDTGTSKRSATSTGQRGETSTDAAQRYLEVAADRMIKDLAREVAEQAGDHGFVVIGGTTEMEQRLRATLPKSLDGRVMVEPSLGVEMRESALRKAVGDAATELTRSWQNELLEHVFDHARASGRATMGLGSTVRALEEMRVDTLLLSRSRVRGDPEEVERLIGLAFAGNAHVEETGGAAGERLDREAEGIAARLRFTVRGQERPSGAPEERESPAARQERAAEAAARPATGEG